MDKKEKHYVLDHDWLDKKDKNKINKLLLRNLEDFVIFFNEVMNPRIFDADLIGYNRMLFQDGSIYASYIEICNKKNP